MAREDSLEIAGRRHSEHVLVGSAQCSQGTRHGHVTLLKVIQTGKANGNELVFVFLLQFCSCELCQLTRGVLSAYCGKTKNRAFS